ncbi:GNAT family N-acetyltransferase [Pedobacter sp. N36a]|uniref:GNAT family N-acetyltransferase n=1 Tax=Pedobacter sp. N36a TaxID=2767996 RepID=UPI0016575C55|nr:GNAT family N-acetyltransferase [Pedobacter sp. N36a]MBC8984872.1 GNAT family N-acetyltransferase [Pedobacter sp. N36a]
MEYQTVVKKFKDLTPDELYQILRLRNEVFVVEQKCSYQDTDNKDQHCDHLMLLKDGILVAYARLVPAGLSFSEVSIGRVVTSSKVRGTGAGKVLMKLAIEKCHELFGKVAIRIGAQTYAKDFYAALGFKETDIAYFEDDIPHMEMIMDPS